MRRRFKQAVIGPLVVAATAAVVPLVTAVSGAADSVVVGGFPVDISQSPWTVALSSRDRFGGTRAGQFCGGVAVGRTAGVTPGPSLAAGGPRAPPPPPRA